MQRLLGLLNAGGLIRVLAVHVRSVFLGQLGCLVVDCLVALVFVHGIEMVRRRPVCEPQEYTPGGVLVGMLP